MNSFTLYLLLTLDSIGDILLLFAIISGIMSGLIAIFYGMAWADGDSRHKKMFIVLKYILSVFIACCVLAAITPSTKQAIIIWGVPAVVNNEQIQDIGKDSLTLIQKTINKELEKIEDKEVGEIIKGEED